MKRTMYIQVEHHILQSGTPTKKWSWWFKDERGSKTRKLKCIHNKDHCTAAYKLFKQFSPDGIIKVNDKTK